MRAFCEKKNVLNVYFKIINEEQVIKHFLVSCKGSNSYFEMTKD